MEDLKGYKYKILENGKIMLYSIHPYDLTDYCYAISQEDGTFIIFDYLNNDKKAVPVNYDTELEETLEIMQEIDSEKTACIDRI